MQSKIVVIVFLSIMLLLTNAWWLYSAIDFGLTHTYAMQACDEDGEALKGAIALLPVVAKPDASRDEIIAAAKIWTDEQPFEKDGFTWVGRLGLRFDEQGKLVEVSR